MLSKRELESKYKELEGTQIRRDSSQKKFSKAYLQKSVNTLEFAGILDIISKDKDKKASIGIPLDREYYDWIIITSYYAMYHAATAALADTGIKTTTHGATVIALDYWYCREKNLLERKYIDLIEKAKFGDEDIQTIDKAMKIRTNAQYTVSKKYNEAEAKRLLTDAKSFVNKIKEIIPAK